MNDGLEPKPPTNYTTDECLLFAFDLLAKSRYANVVLIQEDTLAPFRGDDGLCRLKAERLGMYANADFSQLLADLAKTAKQPNLMWGGALKTVYTWDHFEALSDRVGHGVVAVLAFTDLVPVLPVTRNWMAFQHQAAGYACRQKIFIGTAIEPKPAIKSAFVKIAKSNYYACRGWFEDAEVDPELTASYMATIHALGLACGEQARAELCESVYPVDATSSSMDVCFDDVGDLTYLTEDRRTKPLILFLSANSD